MHQDKYSVQSGDKPDLFFSISPRSNHRPHSYRKRSSLKLPEYSLCIRYTCIRSTNVQSGPWSTNTGSTCNRWWMQFHWKVLIPSAHKGHQLNSRVLSDSNKHSDQSGPGRESNHTGTGTKTGPETINLYSILDKSCELAGYSLYSIGTFTRNVYVYTNTYIRCVA